jgi:hypothetical protein
VVLHQGELEMGQISLTLKLTQVAALINCKTSWEERSMKNLNFNPKQPEVSRLNLSLLFLKLPRNLTLMWSWDVDQRGINHKVIAKRLSLLKLEWNYIWNPNTKTMASASPRPLRKQQPKLSRRVGNLSSQLQANRLRFMLQLVESKQWWPKIMRPEVTLEIGDCLQTILKPLTIFQGLNNKNNTRQLTLIMSIWPLVAITVLCLILSEAWVLRGWPSINKEELLERIAPLLINIFN